MNLCPNSVENKVQTIVANKKYGHHTLFHMSIVSKSPMVCTEDKRSGDTSIIETYNRAQ